jgi:hypothetical protein
LLSLLLALKNFLFLLLSLLLFFASYLTFMSSNSQVHQLVGLLCLDTRQS